MKVYMFDDSGYFHRLVGESSTGVKRGVKKGTKRGPYKKKSGEPDCSKKTKVK